jgi:serine/threonine-protein kinase
MVVEFLSLYLFFLIAVSILISFIIIKFRFPAPRIFIPTIIAIIVLPVLIGYLYISYFSSIPEVVVPDLRGKPIESALSELRSLQLRGKYAGSVFDKRYPEGYVVSQRPEQGRLVKAGRTIKLLASSGKRKVLVPNLLGRTVVQAETVLSVKGLYLGEKEESPVAQLDAGIILSQAPLPGEEVDAGTFVSITVSASAEGEGASDIIVRDEMVGEESEPKKDEGGFWPW